MVKNGLLVFVGFMLGLVASVPIGIFFLRSDAGQAALRTYVVTAPQWPDIAETVRTTSGGSPSISVGELFTKTLTVRVPKAYANEDYTASLNSIVADMQQLATTSNALGSLLTEMNARSLGGNYDGFFDLVVRAKLLVAQERALADRLGQNIASLSAANSNTTDATTKSLTFALLRSAEPLGRDMQTYLGALDMLLSGNIPSTEVIKSLGESAKTLSADLTDFGTKLSALTAHFSAFGQAQ